MQHYFQFVENEPYIICILLDVGALLSFLYFKTGDVIGNGLLILGEKINNDEQQIRK